MPTRSRVPKASTALLLVDVGQPARRLPVVYVNDNMGLWRSDIAELVRRCCDLVVLKATLSGFYQTPSMRS